MHAESAAHGYCVGLITPAKLAGVGRANEPCAAPSLAGWVDTWRVGTQN